MEPFSSNPVMAPHRHLPQCTAQRSSRLMLCLQAAMPQPSADANSFGEVELRWVGDGGSQITLKDISLLVRSGAQRMAHALSYREIEPLK